MSKQFVIILAFILSAGIIGFAQEKPKDGLKDPHQKMEMDKVQKVDESRETATKEPWNKVCPVKGNPIEADSPTVEYNGKVYAFCCPGCDTKFAKDPVKYAKNLSEDGKKFIGRK